MYQLVPLPILTDNYVWILHDNQHAWVIDPGEAAPVRDYIVQRGLVLVDILITHHHHDHINGIPELLPLVTGHVIGASKRDIPNMRINQWVTPNSSFSLKHSEINVQVIDTSGHTFDHVSYLLHGAFAEPLLFAGDAIFSAGCGRLFDGTMEALFESFKTIATLQKNTLIACTHEYTLANLAFCRAIDPSHQDTQNHENQVKYAREQGSPSLPTSLALEMRINPYLRSLTMDEQWLTALSKQGIMAHTPFEAFAATRQLKDRFNAPIQP
jgi:hydroxyacylglutathione hydrolase